MSDSSKPTLKGIPVVDTELRQSKYDPPDSPSSVGYTSPQRMQVADENDPLRLECGIDFFPINVEYETYGALSANKDNAILITHALSGDAHAAGWSDEADRTKRPWRSDRPGWWDSMIGPGKPFDTDRYFIICSNVMGSCYGTTGPASTDPKTGKPYGLSFPVVTVNDWVRVQERLVTRLGIEKLVTVCGGSLGGQQAIEWAILYPERVQSVIVLAATPHLMAQGVAFNYAGRHAITSDPNFNNGDYYGQNEPDKGLSVARMIGHITYLSDVSMTSKFGRRFQTSDSRGFNLDTEYQVESYLRHQGESFAKRFDSNAYLYITRAMDYYDASEHGDGDLIKALAPTLCDWMVVSFSSDWLYPPSGSEQLVRALTRTHKAVTYVALESPYGHDGFLLETERLMDIIPSFLSTLELRGKTKRSA
ncbi:MAG: homoserine O-acetyltransferase [Deltaproteobacteria bacterium]|nr:homoserine O-acetyltransferase [bacterium]MCB9478031.1 homoserine O-acetyltransferase [Deltaproteobacteria bacterium]MCB9478099.1 homoserine O-acetyltransferase [Deltaproteobacteria bacterium]MCB9487595.1 homoserine O-acetyltransferase [Deltaproteobacteria bacterium]